MIRAHNFVDIRSLYSEILNRDGAVQITVAFASFEEDNDSIDVWLDLTFSMKTHELECDTADGGTCIFLHDGSEEDTRRVERLFQHLRGILQEFQCQLSTSVEARKTGDANTVSFQIPVAATEAFSEAIESFCTNLCQLPDELSSSEQFSAVMEISNTFKAELDNTISQLQSPGFRKELYIQQLADRLRRSTILDALIDARLEPQAQDLLKILGETQSSANVQKRQQKL